MSIQPLLPEVIAQIKSSTTITSLNGVVCELLKNSLDASSTKIDITVDYSRGSCVVEDNGLGILPSEFGEEGGLGKLYHSSKLASQTPVHGGRGTFIAFLSAVSLLSITSHHHLHHSHNTLTMHKSTVVSRQTPTPAPQYLTSFTHGTRVTMRDLFGNMPVRVKQRANSAEKQRGSSKEWDDLRREIILFLLAWPSSVAVVLREVGTNEKMLIRGRTSSSISTDRIDIPAVCTILSQASVISTEDKPFWVSARASTIVLTIDGAISLLPSATKHGQFISFGIQPVVSPDARSILHDEVNRMFLNSAFGSDEEFTELDASEMDRRAKDGRYKGDGYTNKELRGGKKGVDRWPMFYINIQQKAKMTDGKNLDVDYVLDDKRSSLGAIVELLRAMIWEFLTKHHFRPKASRGRRSQRTTNATNGNFERIGDSNQSMKHTPSIQLTADLENNERKISKTRIPDRDLVAANVKPPPSRLPSSKVDTPFHGWTRIKSGSRPIMFTNPEKIQEVSGEPANIPRPFSAPPRSSKGTSMSTSKSIVRPSTPLFSSNGKIIRRPFKEVAIPVVQSRTPTATPPQQVPQHSSKQSEDVIVWINPITKVKSLINQRTGLTVRANPSISTNASSSTAPRLSDQEKLKRTITSNTEVPSPWLHNVLKTWNNPVFCPAQPPIPQVSFDGPEAGTKEILHGRRHHCSQIDIDRAFKESSAGIEGRISKPALSRAEVISQMDNKFILVKLEAISAAADTGDGKMLVLIDQHAADERIRIEVLLEEFCSPPAIDAAMPIKSGVMTNLLDKPITFEVSLKETRLFHRYKEHFTRWGIIFDVPNNTTQFESASRSTAMQRLAVYSLPPGIAERCKMDPRLLINLIRIEAWQIHDGGGKLPLAAEGDWFQRIHACPKGIIDMLNSRACRSAIMFNDELSKKQCEALVSQLAKCKFPFQCAHGRPSLVPLVDLGRMEMRAAKPVSGEYTAGGGFGAAFNKWKLNMK